jgi:hypothetical protein
MKLHECIACRAKSVPLVVRLYRGTVLKGWHDVSNFYDDAEPETKWLCNQCTRGTLQCDKCKTRFNSAEQRCPTCNPPEPPLVS